MQKNVLVHTSLANFWIIKFLTNFWDDEWTIRGWPDDTIFGNPPNKTYLFLPFRPSSLLIDGFKHFWRRAVPIQSLERAHHEPSWRHASRRRASLPDASRRFSALETGLPRSAGQSTCTGKTGKRKRCFLCEVQTNLNWRFCHFEIALHYRLFCSVECT